MLSIKFEENKLEYKPNELLRGVAEWSLVSSPKGISVHLLWHTEGKSAQDSDTVRTLAVSPINLNGKYNFEFKLPLSPYSYKGELISIIWSVELVIEGGSAVHRAPFTLSPSGAPIITKKASEISSVTPRDL